ncbi:isoaspartyl peptidase/L-asparaginase family protein [Acidipropionibacterium timonense]|uniref:isoaspartyl peptidase/L-asparaginase family protein n=1 Tax=Acidipropionibacterium timonense TaxID=2161818 RepID=UPI001030EB53|nr:isoaspartyl peptidase/L-asparaginase [Acidipropionibacterium timonense]
MPASYDGAMFHDVVHADGPLLVIHGGAGPVPPRTGQTADAYREGLRRAFLAGEELLDAGAPALDVVIAAVRALEDDPLLNAGRGAVLTAAGTVEMDAAVMTGDGRAGAVACSRHARHTVEAARAVMDRTDNVLVVDPPEQLCRDWGLDVEPPEYFVTDRRRTQLAEVLADRAVAPRHGTVGAVARDRSGHLASATSTGGICGTSWGRVGDSPVIGAGTWARDGVVAVSCTGDGEAFLAGSVAHEVDARLRLAGPDVVDAAAHALAEVTGRHATGGLIAVTAEGTGLVAHVAASILAAHRRGDEVVTLV